MSTALDVGTEPDSVFEAACRRLFELHANGYKRPRSGTRRAVRPAAHHGDRIAPVQRRTTLI